MRSEVGSRQGDSSIGGRACVRTLELPATYILQIQLTAFRAQKAQRFSEGGGERPTLSFSGRRKINQTQSSYGMEMTDSIDFERRVKRSIQESIAVKNLLLEDADIVSTIAAVSAGLVDSLDKGTRCSFLEMVEALPSLECDETQYSLACGPGGQQEFVRAMVRHLGVDCLASTLESHARIEVESLPPQDLTPIVNPQSVLKRTLESSINKVKQRQARVGIIGLGYVGLPLALLFTEQGFTITPICRSRQNGRTYPSRCHGSRCCSSAAAR